MPKFASALILPRGNLVGECLPQTLLCGLRRKNFLLPIPAFRAIYVRCKVGGYGSLRKFYNFEGVNWPFPPATPWEEIFFRWVLKNGFQMSVVKWKENFLQGGYGLTVPAAYPLRENFSPAGCQVFAPKCPLKSREGFQKKMKHFYEKLSVVK